MVTWLLSGRARIRTRDFKNILLIGVSGLWLGQTRTHNLFWIEVRDCTRQPVSLMYLPSEGRLQIPCRGRARGVTAESQWWGDGASGGVGGGKKVEHVSVGQGQGQGELYACSSCWSLGVLIFNRYLLGTYHVLVPWWLQPSVVCWLCSAHWGRYFISVFSIPPSDAVWYIVYYRWGNGGT